MKLSLPSNSPILEKARKLVLRPHQSILFKYREILEQNDAMMLHFCGHRRAGKSTGESAAIQSTAVDIYNETSIFKFRESDVDSSFPKIAYIAETQAQAGDIIWDNLCLKMSVFRDVDIKHRELRIFVDRPHLGDHMEIMFRSLRNHNQIRGNKIRYLFVDEAQFLNEESYAKSVIATLTDSKGKGITTGTAMPDGYYKDMLLRIKEEGGPVYIIPSSGTTVFTKDELLGFKMEMGWRAFMQEYECDFDIPQKGTFFSDKLYSAESSSKFYGHSYDPELPLLCGVDLGIAEGMAFWLAQVQGGRIVLLDYFDNYEVMSNVRNDFEDAGKNAWGVPFIPDYFYLPHDSNNRTIGARTPHTVRDVVKQIWPESKIVSLKRPTSKMAVISNTVEHLHLLGMPSQNMPTECSRGLHKLKNYGREVNKDGLVTDKIDKRHGHDHCADALMTLFEGLRVGNGSVKGASGLYKRGDTMPQSQMIIGRVNPRLSYYAMNRNRREREAFRYEEELCR